MEMLDCACLLAEMSEVRGESAEKAERPAMSAQGGMMDGSAKSANSSTTNASTNLRVPQATNL